MGKLHLKVISGILVASKHQAGVSFSLAAVAEPWVGELGGVAGE